MRNWEFNVSVYQFQLSQGNILQMYVNLFFRENQSDLDDVTTKLSFSDNEEEEKTATVAPTNRSRPVTPCTEVDVLDFAKTTPDSDRVSSKRIIETPKSHRLEKSADDLWTDDDFDSDSFLAATQEMFTNVKTPPQTNGKRRNEFENSLEPQTKNGRFNDGKETEVNVQWKVPNPPQPKPPFQSYQSHREPLKVSGNSNQETQETLSVKKVPTMTGKPFVKPASKDPITSEPVSKPQSNSSTTSLSLANKSKAAAKRPVSLPVSSRSITSKTSSQSTQESNSIDQKTASSFSKSAAGITSSSVNSNANSTKVIAPTSVKESALMEDAIPDELLAVLAEPYDDIFDSQPSLFDTTYQDNGSKDNIGGGDNKESLISKKDTESRLNKVPQPVVKNGIKPATKQAPPWTTSSTLAKKDVEPFVMKNTKPNDGGKHLSISISSLHIESDIQCPHLFFVNIIIKACVPHFRYV